eukprot:m.476024 g.476024  ORF g.476024 m.476024 type:complete len:91 (-) comp20400_c0_seq1:96-368(-)
MPAQGVEPTLAERAKVKAGQGTVGEQAKVKADHAKEEGKDMAEDVKESADQSPTFTEQAKGALRDTKDAVGNMASEAKAKIHNATAPSSN